MTDQYENTMIAQVASLPDMIRTEFKNIDHQVRELMNHEEFLTIKRVVITGCGDSHMAGLATELAFEQIAGIPTEPMRAMKGGRYAAPYTISHYPHNPLVIGISVSGTVARTREAVGLFVQKDRPTVAITGNPESPLAQLCDMTINCAIPEYPFAPGVRSYRMSLLALYLLAIRLGEVQDRYSQGEADVKRESLLRTADAIEATFEAVNEKTLELAKALADEKSFVFIGDGPNFGTALFGAAKLIEASGVHAMGQESEEWVHLQYFTDVESSTPSFLISPGFRGHDRVRDLMPPLTGLGRTTIAIAPEGDQVVSPLANWVLPVIGDIPEAFTPMVYPVAAELFSAHLSDVIGKPFFRRDNPNYDLNRDYRTTEIITNIDP